MGKLGIIVLGTFESSYMFPEKLPIVTLRNIVARKNQKDVVLSKCIFVRKKCIVFVQLRET
jgi:hypothetical protein